MKGKKIFTLLLVFIVCIHSVGATTIAFGTDSQAPVGVLYATGRFSMEVPGGTIVRSNSSLPLEAGETVTIKASYSPFSASVDFGLISPDGYFYYINVNNGSFDKTIKVDKRGNYTFAVQNNSSQTISVSGYVNY